MVIMNRFIIYAFFFTLYFHAAGAEELENKRAELFLRWNGEVMFSNLDREMEFSASDSTKVVLDALLSGKISYILILRDKGWQSASVRRADLVRYDEIVVAMKKAGIAYETKNVSSRAFSEPKGQP